MEIPTKNPIDVLKRILADLENLCGFLWEEKRRIRYPNPNQSNSFKSLVDISSEESFIRFVTEFTNIKTTSKYMFWTQRNVMTLVRT